MKLYTVQLLVWHEHTRHVVLNVCACVCVCVCGCVYVFSVSVCVCVPQLPVVHHCPLCASPYPPPTPPHPPLSDCLLTPFHLRDTHTHTHTLPYVLLELCGFLSIKHHQQPSPLMDGILFTVCVCVCVCVECSRPCTEEVGTCGDTCDRPLTCGIHTCSMRCHHGNCETCRQVNTHTHTHTLSNSPSHHNMWSFINVMSTLMLDRRPVFNWWF